MKILICRLSVISLTLLATLTVQAQAPVNDSFGNAIVLSGPTVTATGNNVGAGREFGEPRIANNFGGASVWWSWTAPSSGLTTIDTSGSSFNTLLGVLIGNSVNSLATIVSNDDYNGNSWSRVQFNAT